MWEKVQKWLKTAEASNLRLKRLVKDIMDLTQIQRGKFTVNRQDTALKKLIQTAVTEVISQNPSFEGRIETNIDDIIVNCDGDRITQVLVNLLNNSMRYAPNSEVISVQLKTQNGNAIYSIADMGPGISNDKQEKVFQPFFQCKDGFNYSGSLGLGLSISKEIIEHHEGSISVQANHPKGAKFIFTLPLSVGASI